jgi:hypothetical protein
MKQIHTRIHTQPGTPALIDPLRDYARHQDMDYNAALDCGLEGTVDLAYMDARPPSRGAHCPENPTDNTTAYMQFVRDNVAQRTSTKRNLGQCKVRNSACSELCVTGGIATSACDTADFDAYVVFNGAEIGVTRTLHDKASDMVWVGLWQAQSGGVYVQRHHQPLEGGPIPEGLWRVGVDLFSAGLSGAVEQGAVALLPCCRTNVYERTACEAYDPRCVSRFWLYNDRAATWTERQGVQVSDREGIYVGGESFMRVVAGLHGRRVLLIVDYSAKLRTDDIQLTSNRWRAYIQGLWDYKGTVIGEKVCQETQLSASKDFTTDSDFTLEGATKDWDIGSGESGFCDSGPRKGKLCADDSDCEDDSDDRPPGSFIVTFRTAEPKCTQGSRWLELVQETMKTATDSAFKGGDETQTQTQTQTNSTGETLGRVCFLECWIGVPFFRLAVNIQCGLSLEFTMVGRACFFPEPGALLRVGLLIDVYMCKILMCLL